MTKLVIIVVILALPACAGSPDVRYDTYSKGENLLQSGLIAYRKSAKIREGSLTVVIDHYRFLNMPRDPGVTHILHQLYIINQHLNFLA